MTLTDSIIVTERLRDTVVRIEADSSMIEALIECDSMGRAHLRELLDYRSGERLRPPKISIQDNILTASAEVDSMSIYLSLKDQLKEVYTGRQTDTTEYIEVNRLTWWQTLWVWAGKILTPLVLAAAAFRIYKQIR